MDLCRHTVAAWPILHLGCTPTLQGLHRALLRHFLPDSKPQIYFPTQNSLLFRVLPWDGPSLRGQCTLRGSRLCRQKFSLETWNSNKETSKWRHDNEGSGQYEKKMRFRKQSIYVAFCYFVFFTYLGFYYLFHYLYLRWTDEGWYPKREPQLRYNFNHRYKNQSSLLVFFFSIPLTESVVS